ncbi:MAG TPA: hypothetical protein VE085_08360 [Burkholderiales bacterium]|nr:hypothetical protein [Burkholderiales bacterium]
MRTLALLFLFALSASAFPQAAMQTQILPPTIALSNPLEVQRLAPQLVAFAGGQANFDNLVNGLASGIPISLTTALPTGGTQVVTFTPSGTMTTLQIAQTLENVRQSLITRGVAAPTAQQIAAALTGGALVTPAGTAQVNGVVTTTTNASTAVQQSPAAALQNTFSQGAAGASRSIRNQTSDSPFPRGISDTPPASVSTPAPIAVPQSTAPLRTR